MEQEKFYLIVIGLFIFFILTLYLGIGLLVGLSMETKTKQERTECLFAWPKIAYEYIKGEIEE